MKTRFTILIFSFFISLLSYGQTIHGSQIDFERLDSFQYQVRLEVIADCNDGDFVLGTHGNFSLTSMSYADSFLLSPSLVSKTTITNAHDSVNVCGIGNTTLAFERYTYIDTINFNTTYDTLKTDSIILFQFVSDSFFTATNINYSTVKRRAYNYLELHLQSQVERCLYSPLANLRFSQYAPLMVNHHAAPNNGNDSISYAFGPVLIGFGQAAPLSSIPPFSAYYPGSVAPPYSNPNASPPIGITFDPQTADLILTPTQVQEGDFVVEATIWSKNSSGVFVKTAVARRELIYSVVNGLNNNPPIVNGPYSFDVCSGSQICFNVTTNDVVFVPPPPAVSPAADTVTISWDGALLDHGATFTVINSNARLQTGQFCWTPSKADESSQPYAFKVRAIDNNGPMSFVTERSFRVRVKERVGAQTQFDYLSCNQDTIALICDVQVDSNQSSYSFNKIILDSGANVIFNPSRIHFRSTTSFSSNQQADTILGDTSGTFIIQTTVNNSPQNCPFTTYDTFFIPFRSPIVSSPIQDSIHCDVVSDTLKVPGSWTNIAWSTGDSTANLAIDSPGLYGVVVTDSCGYTYAFEANITLLYSPIVDFSDSVFCPGDSLEFSYTDTGAYDILWSTGQMQSSINLQDSGSYYLSVTNHCGSITDSFHLYNHALPTASILADSSVCEQIEYSFTDIVGPNSSFAWQIGSQTKSDSVVYSYISNEVVQLTVSNLCASDTAISQLATIESPDLMLVQDSFIGCVGDSFIARTSAGYSGWTAWSNGDTSAQTTLTQTGVTYVTRSNYCGTRIDSVHTQLSLPPSPAVLPPDTSLCNGDTITLTTTSLPGTTVRWNSTVGVNSFDVVIGGTYYLTKFNSCGNNKDTMEIESLYMPNTNLNAPSVICTGDTITLVPYPQEKNHSTFWNGLVVNDTLKVVAGGKYVVKVDGQCGASSDSITLLERDVPQTDLGPDTLVNLPFSVALDAGVASSYLWSNGSISRTVFVQDTGKYWVTTSNDCGGNSDTILVYDNSPISVNELGKGELYLYPNPAAESIRVSTLTRSKSNVSIISVEGKLLFETEIYSTLNIDISFLQSGSYIIQLENNGRILNRKFVKL